MKIKIMYKLLVFLLLIGFTAKAQRPPNYTKLFQRYNWISGQFDSTLRIPVYGSTPVGQRSTEQIRTGAIAIDSVNNIFYFYSDSTWYTMVKSVATNTATGITGGTITSTGTLAIDTTLISTRLWRQKGIDSVAALPKVTSVATNTATGITGGTITSTGTLAIDTTLISTRLWRQKGIDSVAALPKVTSVATGYGLSGGTITSTGTLIADTATLFTKLFTTLSVTTTGSGASTWTPATRILNIPTPSTSYVTSVGLALPSELTVTNSPVTSTGTLTGAWANQTAYQAFRRASGTGVPSFGTLDSNYFANAFAAQVRNNLSAGTGISYNSTTGVITNTGIITEVDGSTTNELQTIAVTGTTTGITTLSNSGGSMTIAGAGINTVGVSGSTITITGTEVDGSTSNELQTVASTSDATSHTLTLSNSGGSLQLVEGSNIALTTSGTGLNGIVTIAGNAGTVTSVATNTATGITGGTITSTGTLAIDTTLISTRLWRQKGIDSVAALPRVTSVSGTTNRITSTGGTTPVIDISASYVGQTSLTTLGTITTGTWNGTIIGTPYGGTGVDNSTGGVANTFWARPNGATGAATYRAIVAADVPTLNQNTTGSAATLTTGRTIGITGDGTYTSPSFNGSANVSASITVTGINGTSLAGLATGILKNTTTTGVPSIAVAGTDYQVPITAGDVTASGATSTIGAAKVTLAMMANMATSSLIYRRTAGTGVPEVNTLAQLKTDLLLTGTNSGDQTITLTGDITGSGTGSFATTLATVNSNVGTFNNLTVNGKGLVTAASNVSYLTTAVTSVAMTVPSILSISGSPITTTGTLAVTLASQAVGTVFNNNGGAAAAPVFTTSLVLGNTGTTAGSISLSSVTAGGVPIIKAVGAYGNYDFILPLGAGTSGQVLTSAAGASAMTWSTPITGGSNGLSSSGSNVILGGSALTANSAINTSAYTLTINSSNTTTGFVSTHTGASGNAIRGTSSGSGTPIESVSTGGGIAFTGSTENSSTNAILTNLLLTRTTSGTAANNIGQAIQFATEDASGTTTNLSTELISYWKNASGTLGTRTSTFQINGQGNDGSKGIVYVNSESVGASLEVSGQIYSAESELTDGATIAINFNNGNSQKFTIAGNRTITFANPKAGAKYLIKIKQDATGSRTITWPTITWQGGTTPTLTTTANKTDFVYIYYDGTTYFGEASLNF